MNGHFEENKAYYIKQAAGRKFIFQAPAKGHSQFKNLNNLYFWQRKN